MKMVRFALYAVLTLCLVAGCLCRPQDHQENPGNKSGTGLDNGATTSTGNRSSRLQKPTQVLNTGFDEIVVESNLQVHNRVGSKNKSKIMLPSNSTAAASRKSARSLMV